MSLLLAMTHSIDRQTRVRYALLAGALICGHGGAGTAQASVPLRVEVFTADPVTTAMAGPRDTDVELKVYRLDGIQQVERALSVDLPLDPASARRGVLARLQRLDPQATASMQRAAVGLVRAVEYHIDRWPAVVFDETAIVYGVTDLTETLRIYRRWREAGNN